MYKDKNKQKEANRLAKERWKAKKADVAALGIPPKGIPREGIPPLERIPERTAQGNIRVSKPGDVDYDGCMELVEGEWRQKPLPDIPLAEYGKRRLNTAIRAYPHAAWVNSPEHKELMHRLHTMTVAELEAEGYFVPCWKHATEPTASTQTA